MNDVTVRGEDYRLDPEVKTTHIDWYAQAWKTEFGVVLFGTPKENPSEETTITEITEETKNDAVALEKVVVKTTTVESSEDD